MIILSFSAQASLPNADLEALDSVAYCMDDEDSKLSPEELEAKKAFPSRKEPYKYGEVHEQFNGVSDPSVMSEFEPYFKVMFHPKFPKPPHGNDFVIEGYRCYYSQMAVAKKIVDTSTREFAQKRIFNELFSIHLASIIKLDNDLGKKLPELGSY
jgi:hypothetical protein